MQDPTNYIHSLRTIADAMNREKRTVQAWYTRAKDEHGYELGTLVNGVRLFTDAERDILTSYAGADRPDPLPEPDTCNLTPNTPSVTVDAGNHHLVLAPPTMPQAFSLESLRSSEAVSFDDPLLVASQFLEVADQLTSAMQQDITQRQQRLQATQKAKQAIEQKAQQLQLEQRLYQLQADQLNTAVSAETTALQEAMAKHLTQLGKEPTAAPGAC